MGQACFKHRPSGVSTSDAEVIIHASAEGTSTSQSRFLLGAISTSLLLYNTLIFATDTTLKINRSIDEVPGAIATTDSVLAVMGTLALCAVAFTEKFPYVGPVATAITTLVNACDQCKCEKRNFSKLKERLIRFSDLLRNMLEGSSHASISTSTKDKFASFGERMEVALAKAIQELGKFAKMGFLSHLLEGSKPQEMFNELDKELTACLNELAVALQIAQFHEQAQTYEMVCDIKAILKAGRAPEGIRDSEDALRDLADGIGADVKDLQSEESALKRLESDVGLVLNNTETTNVQLQEVATNVVALLALLPQPPSGNVIMQVINVDDAELRRITLPNCTKIELQAYLRARELSPTGEFYSYHTSRDLRTSYSSNFLSYYNRRS